MKRKQYWITKLEEESQNLAHLGTKSDLQKYLQEEFKELDLSDSWGEIDSIQKSDTLKENPNNILLYYLTGAYEMPKVLQHKFIGGDLADIDLDFEPEARTKIKSYLRQRFGEKNCLDVATFQGIKAKGAIQDLARIAGVDPQEVYPVTTSIKYNVNNEEENTLDYIIEHNVKVRDFLKKYPMIEENIEKMKEVYRGYGTHASAFIVSSVAIDEYIPVLLNKEKEVVTGYTESSHIDALNKVGLVKLDILGLKNLTINRETEELILDRHGIEILWEKVNINDPKVYKILRKGLTAGIFQLNSATSAGVINTIQPNCFEDLSAVNALIRPACLQAGSHTAYKNHKIGKFNRSKFPVWKDLEGKVSDFTYEILDTTYGIPIYQEQIMALLAEFCEVSLDETNKMRKIISKPESKLSPADREYILEQKNIFIANASRRIGEDLAKQWWDTAVGSLSYGFCRSHSVSYAMLAFRQLWLKRYFPKEFYCALLRMEQASASTNKKSSLMQFIIEARQLGVNVESPNINKSKRQLDYNGDTIYIGFEQIKGVGDAAVRDLIARAPYTSFEDFMEKHKKGTGSKVNKGVIESLIYSNAFSDWGSRLELLEKWHNTYSKDEFIPPTQFQIYKKEKEALSTVLSTDKAIPPIFGYLTITQAIETPTDRTLKTQGVVEKIEKLTSKSGNRYIKVLLNDLENSCKIMVWRNNFGAFSSKSPDSVQVGDIIQVELQHKDGDTMFLRRIIKINKNE